MEIRKVLNNNVAIITKEEKEAVAMGKGICFQKKKGDLLNTDDVTKIFILEDDIFTHKLLSLIKEISIEYFKITEQIVLMAENQLEKKLNDNIYITLTDHINFAVQNFHNDIVMKNSMLWDIKRLYRKEFAVALRALEIIDKEIGVKLTEDEAASISLHLINAQVNQDIPEIIGMMNVVQEILNIVKYSLAIDFDEDSLSYYRFVTHLKFLAERIFSNNYYFDDDSELFELVKRKYVKAFECSLKIKDFIFNKYGNVVSNDELVYLAIHIERVL